MELTVREHMVMQLAGRRYKHAGSIDRDISLELGMTATQFYMVLARLIRGDRALAKYPQLVSRMRSRIGSADRAVVRRLAA